MAAIAAVGLLALACGAAEEKAAPAPAARGTTVNLVMGDEDNGQKMFYTLDKTTVPAGEVTFVATNKGKFEHELMVYPRQDVSLVVKEAIEAKKLGKKSHAGEEIKGLVKSAEGEDELEVEPGKSGRFTVKLAPGTYELACFIVESSPRETYNHYDRGMRALLTVQ